MHYYKRNLGDYAKKAGRLSILQHGAYTLLIDTCYDREEFPTLDEAIDWTWAASTEEVEAVKFVLKKFFELQDDGRYVQKRIKEELDAYKDKAIKNKEIAEQRELKRKENKTNREEVNNETCTKRTQDVNETPPNHKPITNNHKPLLRTSDDSVEIANLLASKILQVNPAAKINPDSWTADIDRALRIDNRTKQQLVECVEWVYSPSGSFWQANILSGKKLREKFDTMFAQASRASRSREQGVMTGEDLLEASV